MTNSFPKGKRLFDIAAISLSIACLLHCVAFPLMLAILPLWGMQFVENESLHTILVFVALPISAAGLWLGVQCHRHGWYLFMGFVGLILLMLPIVTPAESLEQIFTVAGVLLITIAHILNWRLPRVAASQANNI